MGERRKTQKSKKCFKMERSERQMDRWKGEVTERRGISISNCNVVTDISVRGLSVVLMHFPFFSVFLEGAVKMQNVP